MSSPAPTSFYQNTLITGFQAVYLGPFSTAPTLDNNGNPLVVGQLYFNTVTNNLYAYSGTQWLNVMGGRWGPSSSGVPTLATGELYYDSTGAYGEHNAALNIVTDLGASAPSGVLPSQFIFTESQGNNTTFVGGSGLYIQSQDRSTVNSSNKGVLYGINISMAPSITRNNSPFDDVAGAVISNTGSGRGTEAIYFGRNNSLASGDWGGVIGVDAWGVVGQYFTGTYTYGLTFTHGTNSTFSGGVILVPPPASGLTTLIAEGTAFSTPASNVPLLAYDNSNQLYVQSHGLQFNFANNPYYVYTQSNVGGANPQTGLGLAVGGNFSSGGSEIDFFNTTTAAADSFRWYQQTAASAQNLLMDLTPAAALKLGANGGQGGSLTLNGSTSGSTVLSTPPSGATLNVTTGIVSGAVGASSGSLTMAGSTSGSVVLFTNNTASAAQLTTPAFAVTGTMSLGANGGTGGSLTLNGSTSGSITATTPATGGLLSINGYLATNSGGFQTISGTSGTVTSGLVTITQSAAAVTLTLPAATNKGQEIKIKMGVANTNAVSSASSNVVALNATAATTGIIAGSGKFCHLVADGTNWQVMAQG